MGTNPFGGRVQPVRVNRIEIEGADISVWASASASCRMELHRIKRGPSEKVTLSTWCQGTQLWARRVSRCVSPTWPASYAHPHRVLSPLPPTDRRLFLDSRRIELHGRRGNLQSYARELRARRMESYPLHPLHRDNGDDEEGGCGGSVRANSRSPITIPRD